MDESEWFPREADEPHTDVRQRTVDGGHRHEVLVSIFAETANVRVAITEPSGLVVGRIAGDVRAAALSAVGDLIGQAMSAARRAHTGTLAPKPSGIERKRAQHRNHGARWTPEEEALLTERFTAGAEISDLCTEFGRNANSIRARLVQLALLPPEDWPAGIRERPQAA